MSKTSELETMSLCANCGKGEEAGIKLKACTACKLVKYCNRECQIAHRPQHKKDCKKRVKELHEEKLFEQPPPLEDCPICMVRLPTLDKGRAYMECCGKEICCGCMYSPVYDNQGNVAADLCPFCRTPPASSDEEMFKRYKERIELNDAHAMRIIGYDYSEGLLGLSQNYAKALELWHRAGELGDADAYNNIASAYMLGEGVERVEEKAWYYYELAAMKGHVYARHNFGSIEGNRGNTNKALRHWMIAVKDGGSNSLQEIKKMYMNGDATKDVYNKALQYYQAYLDEIKSDQRDKAATLYVKSNYY